MPIAALGVAGWLGLQALARGGDTVTVTFDQASGMKAGDTKVIYRGLEVGEVRDVRLVNQGRNVRVRLRLDRDVAHNLGARTRFWLIGAHVSLTDLASLKALVGGPSIGMEPGAGEPRTEFVGLDAPPAYPLTTPGVALSLTATSQGSLQSGSPVYYCGKAVGKVTRTELLGPHQFRVHVFIPAPYERLVTAETRFWDASAVQVSTGAGGVSAQLVSPEALLAGAVAFDTPDPATDGAARPPPSSFVLYRGRDEAEHAPRGPAVAYRIRFTGPAGALKPGAPVQLKGFRVGEVVRAGLVSDVASGALETPVDILIEPRLLHLRNPALPPHGDWKPVVDALLRKLVARGLRAKLTQSPPLVGGHGVDLEFVPGARAASLITGDGPGEIPAVSSGDFASLTSKADQIMTKINDVPVQQIGDNLRRITARVRALAGSPRITESLDHLDHTLQQVDQTVHAVAPQIRPLVAKLRATADEADSAVSAARQVIGGSPERQDDDLPSALHQMTEAARSIRVLANELERHPEALIRGKSRSGVSP